ncbi:metal ABC transporter substrate-binding protein [Methylopila turkensis]|uniref:ABC transporter substrate-binding protein n=1 Tax=Methylopila turkensis TaxID=1437816 RepID=A0A9W6N7I6_9HYPH|nr:metal ABC transporter substrate-binding protein [Methylopila turkensis]GLK80457.1 ABC transporter substrate-binding protein [Methylopila turkensis]
MRIRALLAAVVAGALSTLPAAAETAKVKAVATFSILGDFVAAVGGDRVSVETLVGPNGDAHVFSPSPADARKVAEAKVLFENGLGLEGWISRLVKSAGAQVPVVVAAKGVAPREMSDEDDHKHGHAHGHDHGEVDPHAWQAVPNAKIYIANVRDGLIAADPDGRATYEANAAAYIEKLNALDAEIRAAWAKVPVERRRIITSHDAFGYYAAAYGVEMIAPQGVSTETEASAKDVARIIRQIKAEKVPAVFVETISDRRLAERIAKETGAKIGGALYSDALSPAGGPAATYLDMMRSNLRELTSALSS